MCGINGIFGFDHELSEGKSLVSAMNVSIRHRGPDDQGYWSNERGTLYFGHLRLSIIDLSPAGHQPMISDRGTSIVFNGEIYNYIELRDRFFKDVPLKSNSDTEILLLLYEKFGEHCLDHLNGMFAFTIWDPHKEELFIARDRSGKKPFYYSFNEGKFAFSSELKALLTLPWMKRELDENALYHFLTFNMLTPPQTMFRGISKLEPGYSMHVKKNGDFELRPFWEVNYNNAIAGKSESEAAEIIRTSFDKALRYRMVSDVPVGAFLSGGVDSSAIVAGMAGMTSRPVNTFSIGFEGQQSYDERFWASKVAKEYKTNHQEIVVTSDDIESFLPRVVSIFDEPMADETCIPIYFLSQKARESGSIVVLTGDGSDELFAGYRNWRKYIRLFPWYEKYSKLPRFMRNMILSGGKMLRPDSNAVEMLSRAANGHDFFWLGARSFKEATKDRFLTRDFLSRAGIPASHAVIDGYRKMYENARRGGGRSFNYTDWMCYLGFKFIVPNYYLYRMDHLGMANSIEIRSPFLDYEFVNTALSVNPDFKLVNNEPKHILKKALEPVLSKEILYRKKMGFCVPIREWAGDIMIDYIEKNLKTFCDIHPMFKYDELNGLLRELKSGRETSVNKLWTLYFLIAWFKRWLD